MGEDDERPNGQAAQSEEPEEDPDTVAARLWALVGLRIYGLYTGLPVCRSALHCSLLTDLPLYCMAGQVSPAEPLECGD